MMNSPPPLCKLFLFMSSSPVEQEKRKLKADLTVAFQYLRGAYKQKGHCHLHEQIAIGKGRMISN